MMPAGQPSADTAISTPHPTETAPLLGGVVRVFLATVLWSSSGILIDALSTTYRLTPLQISSWRVLLAAPIVAIIVAVRRPAAFQLSSRQVPQYALYGLVGISVSYLSWATSVQINKPAVAAALSFSAPAFIALGDRFVFGTRLYALQIGAVAVNLLGCGLATGVYSLSALAHSPTGLLVGLTNGMAFSIYTLIGKGMARTGRRDPLTTLLYIFVFGAAGLVTWGLLAEGPRLVELRLDGTGWLMIVGLGVGPTLVGYALFNSSLRVLPATVASLITTLEPPMVAVLAYVLLGRHIRGLQWLGIALIVGAVMAMQLSMLHRRPRRDESDGSSSDPPEKSRA